MKKNNIPILITVALAIVVGRASAQDDEGVIYQSADAETTKPVVKELQVGDTLPDYEFVHPLVNYPAGTARISDFRGKLLILEFWSRGCVSCIAGFPKLQQLQEKFGDRVQILLINPWSDGKEVMDLLERREQLTGFNMKLPIAFGDKQLSDRFPRLGVPHVVWADEEGVIQSITDGTQLTAENVQAMVDGKQAGMRQASTRLVERDWDKPIFVAGNGGDGEQIVWHSVLSKAPGGLAGAAMIRNNKVIMQQTTIEILYQCAYGNPSNPLYYNRLTRLPKSRIVFEGIDDLDMEELYVYELTAPEESSREELLGVMQQDLARYLGLTARWEKRDVPCLVLRASDTSKLSNVKRQDYPAVWSNTNELTVHIENATMPELFFWMERNPFINLRMPLIDETGYNGRITGIRLTGIQQRDWRDWNRHLKRYGLQFAVENREMSILVVSR